ncbi:MAG TPA: sigma factor, partial [Casimicrobium huifangae]|nr:sigma factor [Casimicrobium huifangae]
MQDRETALRPLMIAACDGNQQAYVTLLSEMAKLLRGFFRKRMLSVPDDVEDVVQEVLIAIHNQRHTYDAGQPVTAWVFGIARYKLADFYRRRGSQGNDHVDIDDAAEWL